MNLSAQGLELLKKSEGFRARVYRDVAGFITIGYGHRVLPGEAFPDGVTIEGAEKILAIDIAIAQVSVERLVRVPLTQGQFDALVDFVFNLGASRLAGSTLLRYLNAGKYDEAALQLLKWDHAGSVELAGLKIRREAEYQLWTGKAAA